MNSVFWVFLNPFLIRSVLQLLMRCCRSPNQDSKVTQGNTCVGFIGSTKNNVEQEFIHSKTQVSLCFYSFYLRQHHLLPTRILTQGSSKCRAHLAIFAWLKKVLNCCKNYQCLCRQTQYPLHFS